MKILILCTGNSCRSQMAQGFLRSFDPELIVRSAGTEPAVKVNEMAVKYMQEAGVDISRGVPENVSTYLNDRWDYVITVCDHANETCPVFLGDVRSRLHMGFEDPSKAVGSEEFIRSEFIRIRDEIKHAFYKFYTNEIKPKI